MGNFSRFFIERPIFASVIAILITLAGIIAGFNLPISQYPEIAPPTVNITTSYPGASAETIANTVAAPIEEQLSGVQGVGDVFIFGAGSSMRVWLNPERMARLGVTPTDVANAIRAQNAQFAAGKIGAEPAPPGQLLTYTVTVRGRLVRVEDFENIVIR